MKKLPLNKQIAIVTGGASGIGLGITQKLLVKGLRVAVLDIKDELSPKLPSKLLEKQNNLLFFNINITKNRDIENALKTIIRTWGQINLLVNNAGIGQSCSINETEIINNFNHTLGVNLYAPFLLTHKISNLAIKKHWPLNIINITSIHSTVASNGGSAYCASKAGLKLATKCWALELAPYHIRVNAIAPGAIENTGFNQIINFEERQGKLNSLKIPLSRFGLPKDIAEAVVFLLTHSYITGQELTVCGGLSLNNR